MKKSTIFLIILVYIASFIIVGLFGIQVRSYNPIVYVDEIKIQCPEQGDVKDKTKKKADGSIDYYYYVIPYEENRLFRLKAEVLPAETTYPNIEVSKQNDDDPCTLEIIDVVYIHITNLEMGYVSNFTVKSTDGFKVTTHVRVLAVDPDLFYA